MTQKTFIIAEIGINHNGDINLAKKLIEKSKIAGVDAVKFQKRDINLVYSKEELSKLRESPFGKTNKDQKVFRLLFWNNKKVRTCRESCLVEV